MSLFIAGEAFPAAADFAAAKIAIFYRLADRWNIGHSHSLEEAGRKRRRRGWQ
jgi:hypothetical protein